MAMPQRCRFRSQECPQVTGQLDGGAVAIPTRRRGVRLLRLPPAVPAVPGHGRADAHAAGFQCRDGAADVHRYPAPRMTNQIRDRTEPGEGSARTKTAEPVVLTAQSGWVVRLYCAQFCLLPAGERYRTIGLQTARGITPVIQTATDPAGAHRVSVQVCRRGRCRLLPRPAPRSTAGPTPPREGNRTGPQPASNAAQGARLGYCRGSRVRRDKTGAAQAQERFGSGPRRGRSS
jgi:hypothetical protein